MNIDFVNLTLLFAITQAKTKCVTVLVTDDANFYLIGDKRKVASSFGVNLIENYCLNFHSLRLHDT